MDNHRGEWERYESRRKVLLALMILEFLILFGLLGEPVSDYLFGGRYVWFVGFVVWALLAGVTMFSLGKCRCPRCGKKLAVVWRKQDIKCGGCGLTAP
jgi:hypothetical protein